MKSSLNRTRSYLHSYFSALAAETELKKFGQLVEESGSILIDDTLELKNFNDFDFIQVDAKPLESANIPTIARSENAMMSKIITALAAVCQEMDFCIEEIKEEFLDTFLFYGEALEDFNEAEAMKCIARMLPTIQKASNFVDHCSEVILNAIHQMASIRDPKATAGAASFAASPDIHVQVLYEKMGKLLAYLVTLDSVIIQHDNFRGHWATYRRYIKAAVMSPDQFNVDIGAMKQLEKLLGPAENKVIDGNMVKVMLLLWVI